MEDFVMFIVYGIFLFLVGWHARGIIATLRIRRFAQEMEDGLVERMEELKSKHIKIKIEKHAEGYFVYGLEDHSYMAQGATRKELEDNLMKRYPGKFFAAEEANLKEVGFSHESV